MKNALNNAWHNALNNAHSYYYLLGLLMMAVLLTMLVLSHPVVFTLADEIIPVR